MLATTILVRMVLLVNPMATDILAYVSNITQELIAKHVIKIFFNFFIICLIFENI